MEISNYYSHNQVNGSSYHSHRSHNSSHPSTSASRWDVADTFELSLPGEPSSKSGFTFGGIPSEQYISDRKRDINYSQEDLSGIKERFANLTGRQKDITNKLQSFLAKAGGSLGRGDRIKIEVGSDGKAVVGGIGDAKLAKKLENIINQDKAFVNEVKTFQTEEQSISRDLKKATGQSLSDFKSRITELQMGGGMDTLTGDTAEGWVYDKDQCIRLEDQDLYMVDQEFATMISEYYTTPQNTIGAHAVDFSGGNDVLLDADRTVDSTFTDIMKEVHIYLSDVNKGIQKLYEDDPEEAKKHMVSLHDVSIKLDSEGTVTIDGAFSQSGRYDDMVTDAITNSIFAEELKDNPYSGQQNDYFIAAQYLENQYALASDGIHTGAKVQTEYKNGQVKSRLSDPEEEAQLREEISVEAQAALRDLGVQSADSLEIEVGDDGKLHVANMPADKTQRDFLVKALHTLNKSIETRSSEDIDNTSQPGSGHTKTLKGLMAKMDVFLPGGVSKIKAMQPSASVEKELLATDAA